MTTERKIKWTEQQTQAISARGGNVFVAASAGTGKTAVLSGRCVGLISNDTVRPDVLDLLVLTFTEAAAEQMRNRIAQQLRAAFQQTRDTRLARQLILLQGADISTIHSFCKRLITEHFHEVALDPSFRVIDSDEALLLKAEVLERTIEWAWAQDELVPHLRALLRRRDLRQNGGFLSGVTRLHNFLEGVVSPHRWCDLTCRLASADDPFATELGWAQKEMVAQRLAAILERLGAAKTLYESEAPDGKWGARLAEEVVEPVAACLERLEAGDWPACARTILGFDKPRAPHLRGFPETLGELVKALRAKALGDFVALRDLAVINPDYMDAVGRAAGVQTRVLVELVRKFGRLYAEKKRTLGGLDFADLERYALELLAEDAAGETVTPSAAALALRGRYKYIFVDEYQDINPVQQAILDALSAGDNVFGVGDIKQSIYGFRGAEPTIFLQRIAPACVSPSLRVDLNCNFRSAAGVLDFVNHLFARIMTAEVADIDYDEAARLRPAPDAGARTTAPEREERIVELHILDEKGRDEGAAEGEAEEESGRDDLDRVDPRQRQAALIARRIQEMVGAETGRAEFQIYDPRTEAARDVEYRDIVVLMRSLAKKANEYVEVFRLCGIPVSCDATAGYFEATEISDVLCLLKVLDNPQRDIEFAAVLRSPLLGFSDTELARIRLHAQDTSQGDNFYTRAVAYRRSGPDATLKGRLEAALATLEAWRSAARRGNLADLLWRVYRETNYIAFVSALPNGQARKANLLKLHDRAVQFEGFAGHAGVASLTRFVGFIERLQETGQDWAPAQPGSAAGNAVRLLSVHKSKGLEFPVVFLAELETEFNQRDIYSDVVLDARDTLGLQIIDSRSNSRLRSLAHQVIGEKKYAASLAEEMRILYVATTRARERLVLTAAQKRTDCGRLLAQGLLLGGKTMPGWLLQNCKSSLEWLLCGLSDQRVLHDAFDTGLGPDAHDDGLFDFKLHGSEELRALSQFVVSLRDRKARPADWVKDEGKPSPAGTKLLAEIKTRLNWRYAFAEATRMPAKRSVTELTHANDEFAQLDYARALERRPLALATEPHAQPRLAREIGTAAHLVLAEIDLGRPVTRSAIDKTKARLVGAGAMTPDVADGIDAEEILAFFESELGATVLDANNEVRREWPFTFAEPAAAISARAERGESAGAAGPVAPAQESHAASEELVVVQGIIDLLVETPAGLVVIDFKTDRVSGAELEPRVEIYRRQLQLYARAARGILQQDVAATWLYFLSARQAVQV